VNEVNDVMAFRERPVYITNWSYLSSAAAEEQVWAMDSIDGLFVNGSPIEWVYWFADEHRD
jgi:hypothetical protein